MTLRTTILKEIDAKRLNPQWTTTDLLDNEAVRSKFARSTILTAPANRSCSLESWGLGDGHNANTVNPAFFRVGRRDGTYLYSLPEHTGPTAKSRDTCREDGTTSSVGRMIEDPDDQAIDGDDSLVDSPKNVEISIDEIAARYVSYLRQKPYRIMLNTKKGVEWSPAEGPVTGWEKRLREYRWGGQDWTTTSGHLSTFVSRLEALRIQCESSQDDAVVTRLQENALQIYNDVRSWGNPKGKDQTGATALKHLKGVWHDQIGEVDSTLTKLYAFARPDEYAIYDSRVAAAMMTIAEDIFRVRGTNRRDTITDFQQTLKFLGRYPGAGGTRVRGYRSQDWPNAYTKAKAQLDANKLCRAIVNCLNGCEEDGRSNWTIREVEAVLFMEGY